MGTSLIEGNVIQVVHELIARVDKLEKSDVHFQELSEMADDLGLFMAGEIRVPFDILDPKEPGEGFSGVRILGEFEYPSGSGTYYAIVGINDDALMFGLSAETGAGVFGGGNIVLDIDGITGTDLLKWMIKQTATNGANTRTGKLGLALQESGGTIPVWELSYASPGGGELLLNGGFEDGDFTNWTKTTETNGTWSIAVPYHVQSGSYAAGWNGSAGGLGVLTSDRIGVTALANYSFSGYIRLSITATISVKWYDHASAGSLLQTDIIRNGGGAQWTLGEATIQAPATALSCAIVLTGGASTTCYFDTITVELITINQKLQLTDDGMQCTFGFYPDSAFGTFGQFKYFSSAGVQAQMANNSLVNSSVLSGHYAYPSTAQGADGDYYTMKVPLVKGTYNFLMNYVRNTTNGKADFYFDGVNYGAIKDFYGALSYVQEWLVEEITAAYDGIHEIKFVVNGKNGSSSDYVIIAADFIMYEDV